MYEKLKAALDAMCDAEDALTIKKDVVGRPCIATKDGGFGARVELGKTFSNSSPDSISPSMRKYLCIQEAEDKGTSAGAKKGWEKRLQGLGHGIPDVDYSSWKSKVGHGIRTWGDRDTDETGPRGPKFYPVYHFKEYTPEIREAIRAANSCVPRPGESTQRWFDAHKKILKLGGLIENYLGDDIDNIEYGYDPDTNTGHTVYPYTVGEDKGTSEGAKKGWEVRKNGGGSIPQYRIGANKTILTNPNHIRTVQHMGSSPENIDTTHLDDAIEHAKQCGPSSEEELYQHAGRYADEQENRLNEDRMSSKFHGMKRDSVGAPNW